MRRILGVLALLMGTAILAWIAYNFLVEKQPEAAGQSPLPGLIFGTLMVIAGVYWVRGKQPPA
jgi:hypothetical protein